MNQQLIDFVKSEIAAGVPFQSMLEALTKNGWSEKDIRDAVVASRAATPFTVVPVQSSVALKYGGFWIRFAAFLVDGSIYLLVYLAVFWAISLFVPSGFKEMVFGIFSFVYAFLFQPILESSSLQGTFGKRLLGLEVTDREGNRVSFFRALGRHFAKLLSIIPFGIGFLIIGFTAQKRGLHDIAAGTLVLERRQRKSGLSAFVFFSCMLASAAIIFFGFFSLIMKVSTSILSIVGSVPTEIIQMEEGFEGFQDTGLENMEGEEIFDEEPPLEEEGVLFETVE